MVPPLQEAVGTRADTNSPATNDRNGVVSYHDAWQRLIDDKLMKWLHDPSQLDDDGVDAPTGTILRLVIDHAERFRDQALPPPDSIVPDCNGGVVFERREDDVVEVFHFWQDGTLEYQQFRGTTLIERSAL